MKPFIPNYDLTWYGTRLDLVDLGGRYRRDLGKGPDPGEKGRAYGLCHDDPVGNRRISSDRLHHEEPPKNFRGWWFCWIDCRRDNRRSRLDLYLQEVLE